MCDKAILENGETLKSLPATKRNKNQELTATKIKKCVIKQLIITFMH